MSGLFTHWYTRCTSGRVPTRPRVIVSLPDSTEAAAVADWLLADGYEPVKRSTPQAAADELRDRRATLLIVDAAHTVYLTRPLDRATLGCFVSMAILDGRPVRKSVRKSVNRFDAVVNGVPSHIVDVSAEGLRLEMANDRRAALPPYFTVRVPLAGVAVTVQRMWTHASLRRGSGMEIWYGGALSQNRVTINEAWRRFVDSVPVVGAAAVRVNL
jgi:hypothetical protein